jgi:ABC-type phosphate/phosphonate transport system permease subunit
MIKARAVNAARAAHGCGRPTLAAILLSVPVAFLAARNTTPSAAFVRPLALFLIVALLATVVVSEWVSAKARHAIV